MTIRSLRTRWNTWVSIWVLLLSALVPAAARMAQVDGSHWVVVCTSMGTALVASGSNDLDPRSSPNGEARSACTYCLLAAATIALPPQDEQQACPIRADSFTLAAPLEAPAPAVRVWRIALPRAPPAAG